MNRVILSLATATILAGSLMATEQKVLEPLWQNALFGSYGNDVGILGAANGQVYTRQSNTLTAFDNATGEERWSAQTADTWSQKLLFTNGFVAIQGSNSNEEGVSYYDWKLLNSLGQSVYETRLAGWSAPIFIEPKGIFLFPSNRTHHGYTNGSFHYSSTLTAVDANGQELFAYEDDSYTLDYGTIISKDGNTLYGLYYSYDYDSNTGGGIQSRKLVALDLSTGSSKWEIPLADWVGSFKLSNDGNKLFYTINHYDNLTYQNTSTLYAANTKTGASLWQKGLGSNWVNIVGVTKNNKSLILESNNNQITTLQTLSTTNGSEGCSHQNESYTYGTSYNPHSNNIVLNTQLWQNNGYTKTVKLLNADTCQPLYTTSINAIDWRYGLSVMDSNGSATEPAVDKDKVAIFRYGPDSKTLSIVKKDGSLKAEANLTLPSNGDCAPLALRTQESEYFFFSGSEVSKYDSYARKVADYTYTMGEQTQNCAYKQLVYADGILFAKDANNYLTVLVDGKKLMGQTLEVNTNENRAVTFTLSRSDESHTILTQPTHGTLEEVNGHQVKYIPQSGFSGNDLVTYKLTKGSMESEEYTVSITVNAVNRAPTANDLKNKSVVPEGAVALQLKGSDMDNDKIYYLITQQPTQGTLVFAPESTPDLQTSVKGGAVIYVPNSGATGNDSFGYQSFDGQANSQTATVEITIQ